MVRNQRSVLIFQVPWTRKFGFLDHRESNLSFTAQEIMRLRANH